MKKAIILHGTSSSSQSNWFPWLKGVLEAASWQVWVPDLPGADQPNVKRYNDYIIGNIPFDIDDQTTIIGHSSGAVETLGLLQELPADKKIHEAILIGSFTEVLANDPEWLVLRGLFEVPFDFVKIKHMAEKFTFYHGDDDPYCPLDQAEYLCEQTDGTLRIIHGAGHFSLELDGQFNKFPELRDYLIK